MVKIIDYQDSRIDYPGKQSLLVFLKGCNFNCPDCHNRQVVYGTENRTEEDIINYIEKREGWIGGIVISGGEPTIQEDLIDFVKRIKNKFGRGFGIKLDTNGSNPEVLEELIKGKLVDYIAMDVKAPGDEKLYSEAAGVEVNLENIGKSMGVIQQLDNYEFRTTVVPVFSNGFIEWMSVKYVHDVAKFIQESTGDNSHKYFLQPFVARSEREMIDKRFAKENLPVEFHKTPKNYNYLEDCKFAVEDILPNARIRGEE